MTTNHTHQRRAPDPIDRRTQAFSEEDTPFAALDRQLSRLAFDSDTEKDYVTYIRQNWRLPSLICTTAAAFVWLLFIFIDFVRLKDYIPTNIDATVIAWLTARWATLAIILTSITLIKIKYNKYDTYVLITYTAIGISISIISNMSLAKGQFSADNAQIIIIMCGFLPLGFVFYKALMAAMIVSAFSIAMLICNFGQIDISHQLHLISMIVIALPIAAIGGYFREYADRKQFILGRILEQRATTDPLTGLSNRRKFEEHAEWVSRLAKRDSRSVAMAIVDIDFFKQYNDRYGHLAGDEVIKTVGRVLKQAGRRPLDIVARYGGEEFILLLYDPSDPGGLNRLDIARREVVDLNIEHLSSPFGRITISIGYSRQTASDEPIDDVIARADKALYAAKADGRNAVKFEPGASPDTRGTAAI